MVTIIDLTLDDDEAVQEPTHESRAKVKPFSEFTLFSKLPLELRLLVWSFATPEPAIIVQRKSRVKGRRFFFDRPVPAILQACRESRNEFIEIEPDKRNKELRLAQQASLNRRRREHPVYKLYFRNKSKMSGGAYFSAAIDALFGMGYEMQERKNAGISRFIHSRSPYLGVTELDVARTLKHLVLIQSGPNLNRHDFKALTDSFPCLETFTILIQDYWVNPHPAHPVPFPYAPEINGQLCFSGLTRDQRMLLSVEQLGHLVQIESENFDNLEFPDLKFRFEPQFRAVEKVPTLWHPKQPSTA